MKCPGQVGVITQAVVKLAADTGQSWSKCLAGGGRKDAECGPANRCPYCGDEGKRLVTV